jgi:hypothetical protein
MVWGRPAESRPISIVSQWERSIKRSRPSGTSGEVSPEGPVERQVRAAAQPAQNAYAEGFNGRLRAEYPNANWFTSPGDGERSNLATGLQRATSATKKAVVAHRSPRRAGHDCLDTRGLPEVIQRQAQAGFQVDLRFPAEQSSGFGDVRATLFGIVLRQGFVFDLAARAGYC